MHRSELTWSAKSDLMRRSKKRRYWMTCVQIGFRIGYDLGVL